jgi:hypothetical protein
VNGTPFDPGLPFFVALFISFGTGSVRNLVVWPNISFRASEVNSATQSELWPAACWTRIGLSCAASRSDYWVEGSFSGQSVIEGHYA